MTPAPATSPSSKLLLSGLATVAGKPRRGRHRRRRAATRVGVLAAMLPLVAVPVAAGAAVQSTPAPNTVLTISPFSNSFDMTKELQGSLCRTPDNCVPVTWSPSFYVPAGETALNTAMAAQSDGPYTVFAYSQGAEVAEQWIKQHADDPDAPDPADVKFVLIGNPTRVYGGTGSLFGETVPPSQYQVVDISREYDFVSDFPNQPFSPFYLLAIANAMAGLATVHLNYQDVNVDDPANTEWRAGNTTYILVPTPSLPLLAPLQAMGINTSALNAVLKPAVDSAYDRTYGGTVTPEPVTVSTTAATGSAPLATAAKSAVSSAAATAPSRQAPPVSASSDPAPAVVDGAVADTAGPSEPDRAAATTTGGNKFEPRQTGGKTTKPPGGQNSSGSPSIGHDIGSALGKIANDIKKATTHQ